jgi:hypothetical protein
MHRFKPGILITATLLGLGLLAQAHAEGTSQPAHGEFAASIRSAGQPCNHVLAVSAIKDRLWSVRCNAGTYTVRRDDSGRLVLVL